MIYEKSCGTIIFKKTKEELKFLLLEANSISKKNPHTIWAFPKGLVERGEDDIEAALRELKEETGIVLPKESIVPNFKSTERFMYRRGNEFVSKIVHYYLAELKNDQELKLSKEHINYAWLTYEEAEKVIKIKAIKDTLKKAYDYLTIGPIQQNMLY